MNRPSSPLINPEKCTGCGRCVAACRINLLSLEAAGYRKAAVIRDRDRCLSCGSCADACHAEAIGLRI